MFGHFNARAREVLQEAEASAHGLAHHYIGTEHVLVGLARGTGSSAQQALAGCGLDAEQIELQVEELLGRGRLALSVRPPFTSSASLVLERSRWEARTLGADQVGTAHVLLGLVRVPDSTAATVLGLLGVEPADIEAALRTGLLRRGSPPESDQAPAAVRSHLAVSAARAYGRGDLAADPATDPKDPRVDADGAASAAAQIALLRREVARLRAEVERLSSRLEDPFEPA